MKARLASIVLGCFALGGCIAPLVGLGVQVGAQAIGAGIDAVSSDDPEIAAYCWDPKKQSASTSSSPSCWSPQVRITEDEYDRLRETGVAPASAGTRAVAASATSQKVYCVTVETQNYFILSNALHCPAGDVMLPEAEWRSRQAQQLAKSQATTETTTLVYCWDPELALEYVNSAGMSCGDDRRITEEQYKTQRSRREEAEKAKVEAPQQAKSQQPPIEVVEPAPAPVATVAAVQQPAASPSQQAAKQPQELLLDAFEIRGFGTGFFVSANGDVLTNHHVVSECDAVAGITPAGIYEATTRDSNARFDLAVLQMPIVAAAFATFAAGAPEQGDNVYVIGFPLLDDFREIKITNGIVSGLSGPDRDTSLIQMTAAVQPGNSGGPLVSQAGSIVGVVVGKYTGEIGGGFYAEGINFAAAHEAAAAFLKLNRIEVRRAASTKEMKNRDLMKRAEQWTIPLLCLTTKAPG